MPTTHKRYKKIERIKDKLSVDISDTPSYAGKFCVVASFGRRHITVGFGQTKKEGIQHVKRIIYSEMASRNLFFNNFLKALQSYKVPGSRKKAEHR